MQKTWMAGTSPAMMAGGYPSLRSTARAITSALPEPRIARVAGMIAIALRRGATVRVAPVHRAAMTIARAVQPATGPSAPIPRAVRIALAGRRASARSAPAAAMTSVRVAALPAATDRRAADREAAPAAASRAAQEGRPRVARPRAASTRVVPRAARAAAAEVAKKHQPHPEGSGTMSLGVA